MVITYAKGKNPILTKKYYRGISIPKKMSRLQTGTGFAAFLSPIMPLTANDQESDAGNGKAEEQDGLGCGDHDLHHGGWGTLERGGGEHKFDVLLDLRLVADHLHFPLQQKRTRAR